MKKIVIMLALLLCVSVGVNFYLYNQLSSQTALANAAEEQQKELAQKMTDLQAQIDGLQSEITNLKTENESLRASLAESQVESSVPTVEEIIASMGDEDLFNSSSSAASKPVEQQKPPVDQQKPPVNSSSKPSGGSTGGTDWSQHKIAPGAKSTSEVEVDYGRGPAGPDGNLGFS